MEVVERLVSSLAAVALALLLFASGFLVCLTPIATAGISNIYADDVSSDLTRSQLVTVAGAVRDYSFGNNDQEALYGAIVSVDQEYADAVHDREGTLPKGFPNMKAAASGDYDEAFDGASSHYCLTADEVSHLDDVHAVATAVYGLLIGALIVAIAGIVASWFLGQRRLLGWVLMVAGIASLGCFILLGLWALIDFDGLFASMHAVLFPQGNWTFAADSLLICALPQGFWGAMGALWFIISIMLSIASTAGGFMLRRDGGARHRSKAKDSCRRKSRSND